MPLRVTKGRIVSESKINFDFLLVSQMFFSVISMTENRKDVTSIIFHSHLFFDYQVSLPKCNGLINKIRNFRVLNYFPALMLGIVKRLSL